MATSTDRNGKQNRVQQLANDSLEQLATIIDEDNEAARLEGAALAGMLLGSWIVAFGLQAGYSAFTLGAMVTVGVVGGLACRSIA